MERIFDEGSKMHRLNDQFIDRIMGYDSEEEREKDI